MNQSWTVQMRSCNDISRKTAGTPLGAVGRGLAAGAVGTLAMDLLFTSSTGPPLPPLCGSCHP